MDEPTRPKYILYTSLRTRNGHKLSIREAINRSRNGMSRELYISVVEKKTYVAIETDLKIKTSVLNKRTWFLVGWSVEANTL